jgi:amino acid adenylation domain-containing protein
MTDFLQGLERVVAGCPSAIAVRDRERSYTYAELARLTTAWAVELANRGVKSERIVGLRFGGAAEYLLGIIATLKAGAAFAIIDNELSDALAARQIETIGADVWLCGGECSRAWLSGMGAKAIEVSSILDSGLQPLAPASDLRQLAYLLHTSGSTGDPKCVMVERQNLENFVVGIRELLQLSSEDVWLQFAAPSFDVFLEETLPLLTVGGTLVCRSTQAAQSLERLHRELMQSEATVIELPTAYWTEYHRWLVRHSQRPPASLRCVLVGGECMDTRLYRDWLDLFEPRLVHVYGITETAVTTTAFTRRRFPGNRVPVGMALRGCAVTVRSTAEHGDTPSGEEGEVFVYGSGVGRGYKEDPALTASRFVPNPYGPPGTRMYASGDVGRISGLGELELMGRVDDEVKIRGRRISLRSVEAALRQATNIADCAVIVDPLWRERLCAFVVCPRMLDNSEASAGLVRGAQRAEIVDTLLRSLPMWAVPGQIVSIANLPRSQQGKVDSKALSLLARDLQRERVPELRAQDGFLRTTISAFRIGLRGVSVRPEDDFFDLGGDSLAAALVIDAVHDTTGHALSVENLFENPTAGQFATLLASLESEDQLGHTRVSGETA